jgi:hypothetical protein
MGCFKTGALVRWRTNKGVMLYGVETKVVFRTLGVRTDRGVDVETEFFAGNITSTVLFRCPVVI